MRNAADYLGHIKALIVLNRQVMHWKVVREEAQGDVGLFRYQLTLRDGSLLEMFERFDIAGEKLQVRRYSFHWQSAGGELRRRWDNAPHHPEMSTHPHHVHEGADANVLAHRAVRAEEVLAIIAAEAGE